MPMTLRDKTAVVGIGATPYYRRGESLPQTELELACKAILAALDDAGLTVRDLDGFTIYSSSCDRRGRGRACDRRAVGPPRQWHSAEKIVRRR